jgi:hypothetical protein
MYNLPDDFDKVAEKISEMEDKLYQINSRRGKIQISLEQINSKIDILKAKGKYKV